MKHVIYIAFFGILFVIGCTNKEQNGPISFSEVSESVGIITENNWKYGGPSISDIDNDGNYDLLLGNHDTTPIQLFWGSSDGNFTEQEGLFPKADLHGIAAGDYDKDGDLDVLLSLGGGNGTSPQPQRLLRNDNGIFTDVTEEAGLSKMGARGRSVRWIDLDNDGDLDFLQMNAEQMIDEEIPRNILFENNGNGTFSYKSSPEFEKIDAERLLITDFNNDDILDIITFAPYTPIELWKGNANFTFSNVSEKYLPQDLLNTIQVITVAEIDFDNDGDLDYYLARGKSGYQIANNSMQFDENLQRLDIRDEGNKSEDGITFYSKGDIELLDFYRFPRGRDKPTIPLFIGKNKTEYVMPSINQKVTPSKAEGFPDELDKSGWYLGYLGEGKWRLEWLLLSDLAWDIRASITGVTKVEPDWEPQKLGVRDILLKNENGHFVDASNILPQEHLENNQGVIPGDFDNDGFTDLFVYRFGKLKQRLPDVLFINNRNGGFYSTTNHGATPRILGDYHGDMGAAFDYNFDGKIDILSGDEDNGQWHLYQNNTRSKNNFISIKIGNSNKGYDAYGAKVKIKTSKGLQFKLIGSASASHSQNFLNTVHFGLENDEIVEEVNIIYRSGETLIEKNILANQIYYMP